MRYLIVEPDPDSDDNGIVVYNVMTRCKRLVVKVDNKDVIIERSGNKLLIKNNRGYVAKRITLKYPGDKPYVFYKKTTDETVEINAESLY
jgi:hypothetical protein